MEAIAPSAVAVEIATRHDAFAPLPAAEHAAVEAAVEKRRREFTAGRTCARRALQRLGVAAAAVPVGGSRQPLWPPGVVGSITHCNGYCAAAVVRTQDVLSIGIDAECLSGGSAQALRQVVTGEDTISGWPVDDSRQGLVVFSAKEALFKAWFQLGGGWLDFAEASVCADGATGALAFRIDQAARTRAGLEAGFHGWWGIDDVRVYTLVVVGRHDHTLRR